MNDIRHIVLLSGGKDSTALAIYLRSSRPQMSVEYVFCDTHKELPETYAYLARIEAFLGQRIVRLSSDVGERGFDHWLQMYGGYLPSPKMRWCTRKLKIEPLEQFIGDDAAVMYVGIRADENRSGYITTKPNIRAEFPFKDAGIRRADVERILEESGVGLPEYYQWRTRSGCYFCFFQRRVEWVGLLQRHPELFDLAQSYEKPETGYTWVDGESLDDLRNPDRINEILADSARRDRTALSKRRPVNLVDVFSDLTDDEPEPCLACHL